MNNLDKLKEEDIYSLAMFVLYKLTNIKEYSVISEIPYVLDKENLFNFCNYFGGRTITVPTTQQVYSLMHIILLYHYVKIDNIPYDDAIHQIGFKSSELRKVKSVFTKLCTILDNYKFGVTNE